MTPRRDPVPRARSPWNWLGGILLLGLVGGGMVAAAVALWEQIDVGRIIPELAGAPGPLPVPRPPPAAAVVGGGFPVVLYRSERNARFFPDSTYYPRELERWTAWAGEAGARVREASDASSLGALSPDEVVVVAEAPCLSTEERRAVRDHLRRGGGVVTNWAVGARNADCGWLGWDEVARLTGAEDVREIPSREALFFTVPAGLPISPGLDPGTRIELRPDPSLALRLAGPRAYWSDWALNPLPDESGGGADAALVLHRPAAGGRVAWFGFRAGQAVTARDSVLLARLVQSGLRWAGGRITAGPAPWPDARRSAALFTMDVEDMPANAAAVAMTLEEEGVPGTFFVVSRTTADLPELGEHLSAAGEVGTHTSDHTPLAGLDPSEQVVRLRRAVREAEAWSGGEVRGLRPPEESFDRATLDAFGSVGGQYVAAVNDARSAAPEVHLVAPSPVVILPRLLKDDYNVFVQDASLRAERLREAFLEGARKLRSAGGIVVFNVHSQILDTPGRLGALRNVIDTLQVQGDWWITTGAEAARWWRARHDLAVTGEAGPGPTFRVDASPDEGIEGLWLDVVLPDGPDGWEALVDEQPVAVDVTDWGLRVRVGTLEPGGSRRVRLAPAPEATGSS
ncbi:MAG: polysaccharide deacetylase family protein [Gemmatimonadota bacterium]